MRGVSPEPAGARPVEQPLQTYPNEDSVWYSKYKIRPTKETHPAAASQRLCLLQRSTCPRFLSSCDAHSSTGIASPFSFSRRVRSTPPFRAGKFGLKGQFALIALRPTETVLDQKLGA